METNKVTNNWHLLNKEITTEFEKEFSVNIPSSIKREQVLKFINKCLIRENKMWINLIEGRQKSHAETEPPIEEIIKNILWELDGTINTDEAYNKIMQAINNRPDLDCIKKGNLEYRIRVLDGTEERISTKEEGE
jgi:hypothetical protein